MEASKFSYLLSGVPHKGPSIHIQQCHILRTRKILHTQYISTKSKQATGYASKMISTKVKEQTKHRLDWAMFFSSSDLCATHSIFWSTPSQTMCIWSCNGSFTSPLKTLSAGFWWRKISSGIPPGLPLEFILFSITQKKGKKKIWAIIFGELIRQFR